MLYVRFPVSRRNVEDLIAARTLPIVNPVRCCSIFQDGLDGAGHLNRCTSHAPSWFHFLFMVVSQRCLAL